MTIAAGIGLCYTFPVLSERGNERVNVAKTYGGFVKKALPDHPDRARALIRLGLKLEQTRKRMAPEKEMPKGYQKLHYLSMGKTVEALKDPAHSAWVNVFAPVELLQCFGLNCTSIELLSSFLSGFYCEDTLIDAAEEAGIASTLCSYHKNFIGGSLLGLVPTPEIAVTTSMVCDGNINTFRYLSKTTGVESYILDIPHAWSPEGEDYVVDQLRELAALLAKKTGIPYREDELSAMLERENESKRLLLEINDLQKTRWYPNTMTMNLFQIYASHLAIGTPEVLEVYRFMRQDIEQYPEYHGKKLFWVHLFPYYQETLKHYLDLSDRYYVCGYDFNLDYTDPLDTQDPLRALARKMILNFYNGDYSRKIEWITRLVTECGADGVIHFNHWGCKQVAGSVPLLKAALRQQGVPMLILDGDALDRRNSHDGQVKTRMEAFFELLEKGGAAE